MRTTLKHIDVSSAFRVGFVLYGLLMLIFGLIYVVFQGALISLISRGYAGSSYSYGGSVSLMMTGGLIGSCILYGVLVVGGAITGGIQGAVLAFFYNRTANWVGGLKIELQTDDALLDEIERDSYKSKRGE